MLDWRLRKLVDKVFLKVDQLGLPVALGDSRFRACSRLMGATDGPMPSSQIFYFWLRQDPCSNLPLDTWLNMCKTLLMNLVKKSSLPVVECCRHVMVG